jgi:hypothetical protein
MMCRSEDLRGTQPTSPTSISAKSFDIRRGKRFHNAWIEIGVKRILRKPLVLRGLAVPRQAIWLSKGRVRFGF